MGLRSFLLNLRILLALEGLVQGKRFFRKLKHRSEAGAYAQGLMTATNLISCVTQSSECGMLLMGMRTP